MNNFELIVLSIQKTFKGTIVKNYPGKGTKLSEAESIVWEGEKPVNPFPVGKQLKTINRRNF